MMRFQSSDRCCSQRFEASGNGMAAERAGPEQNPLKMVLVYGWIEEFRSHSSLQIQALRYH